MDNIWKSLFDSPLSTDFPGLATCPLLASATLLVMSAACTKKGDMLKKTCMSHITLIDARISCPILEEFGLDTKKLSTLKQTNMSDFVAVDPVRKRSKDQSGLQRSCTPAHMLTILLRTAVREFSHSVLALIEESQQMEC